MSRRTTVLPRLLAVALVAAGCSSDALAPRPRRGPPEFAGTAASGITLDQQNSGVGPAGSVILKGFNPTNPHRGDAIVATFIWTGSTNVITSVTDHLATAPPTPVGNTYNLVEYVTAGGVSMATYVATNVQNFPDPCCAPDQQQNILVVQADLSQSVGEAGLIISAYSGVDAASAQAVGAHASAAGSGSSPTTAHPGPVGFNAGALVYGVTMSNAVVGIDGPPPPFSRIANISDNVLEGDGQYAVQTGAGSVDPSWTWFFDQAPSRCTATSPCPWLATALALNPAASQPPPPPAATHLAFTVQPSVTTAGSAISPPVQVAAQDDAGNTDASFTGSITIAVGTNPSGGALSGTTTVTAVNGVAPFSDLSIDQAGNGYTLQATGSGLAG